MALTYHLGFGRFQLADFRVGECFARFNGALAKVIDPQPSGRPDLSSFGTTTKPATPSGFGYTGRR